jgi:thiamine pyrophosphate-dependent acetolactate synthase large subunit-like protein
LMPHQDCMITMLMGDLSIALKHHLLVKIIVVKNGALGMIAGSRSGSWTDPEY